LDRARRLDFSAETRLSGLDLADGRIVRQGAVNVVARRVAEMFGAAEPSDLKAVANSVAKKERPRWRLPSMARFWA
jgi:potassium-transporting ATPase ATP-binding subunit